jgi:hypothetical protein
MQKISRAFEVAVDINTSLAQLSRFSEALRAQDPTFDPRNFGYSSFRKFCDALSSYEIITANDRTTHFLKEKTRKENRPNEIKQVGDREGRNNSR